MPPQHNTTTLKQRIESVDLVKYWQSAPAPKTPQPERVLTYVRGKKERLSKKEIDVYVQQKRQAAAVKESPPVSPPVPSNSRPEVKTAKPPSRKFSLQKLLAGAREKVLKNVTKKQFVKK